MDKYLNENIPLFIFVGFSILIHVNVVVIAKQAYDKRSHRLAIDFFTAKK